VAEYSAPASRQMPPAEAALKKAEVPTPPPADRSITCKAMVAFGVNDLREKDIVVAYPRAGEVRVKVICNALCHTDVCEPQQDRIGNPQQPCGNPPEADQVARASTDTQTH